MIKGFLLATFLAFVVLIYSPCIKDTGAAAPETGLDVVFPNLRLFMTRELGGMVWTSFAEEQHSLKENWHMFHGVLLHALKEVLLAAGAVGLSQLPLLSARRVRLRPAFRWGAVFLFVACAIAAGVEAFKLPIEHFGPFDEGRLEPRFGIYLYLTVYAFAAVTVLLRISAHYPIQLPAKQV